MGEMYSFELEFPQRTIALLDIYDGIYTETLLINCLTGLLVLPKEMERGGRFVPDLRVNRDNHPWGLRREYFEVDCEQCGLSLRNIIRKLRNAVAHGKIEPINNEYQIVGFVFSDRGFRAEIPLGVLKEFALSFARHYLDVRNSQR